MGKATREEQKRPISKVTKEPRLSHTCAFQVLTQGSKCAEYNGAEESAIKTQLRTNKSTRQGATALLLDKKEPSWRVLFTVPCYQSLNSEQTVCLRGHRRTGCSLYSRRFPPTAHPFYQKKTVQSQHPKSHRIHCNYSSQFTFGMPLSILMKTWKRQVCIPLAEMFNPCSALTSHLHRQTHRTDMHAHILSLSAAHTQLFGCGLALTEM